MSIITKISFLLIIGFIEFVEGPLNPFWVWNALPIVLGYVLLSRSVKRSSRPIPELSYVIATTCFVVLFHIAWMLDLGGTQTGSSTSGLIFIFLPIYAVLLGGAAFGLGYLFGRRREDARDTRPKEE